MEPKFKTSFIPKKSLSQNTPQPTVHKQERKHSLASVFAFLMLVIALGVSGVVFFYTSFLESSIANKAESLERAREAFQPALIKELERLDDRIESAEQILQEHIAPSGLFSLLEATTLKSVRFQNMTYSMLTDTVEISLEGEALNFDAVALQSDVFGSNRFIREPIISGLDITGDNLVAFTVTAQIEKRFLSFENLVAAEVEEANPQSAQPISPQQGGQQTTETGQQNQQDGGSQFVVPQGGIQPAVQP